MPVMYGSFFADEGCRERVGNGVVDVGHMAYVVTVPSGV